MDDRQEQLIHEDDAAYGKLFRNALGGFNKDDVLNYLEKAAKSRRKETERFENHVQKLETRVSDLQAALTEQEKIQERTEQKLAEANANPQGLETLRAQLESLILENENLKAENTVARTSAEKSGDEAAAAIAALREELEKVRAESASLHNAASEAEMLRVELEKVRSVAAETDMLREELEKAHCEAEALGTLKIEYEEKAAAAEEEADSLRKELEKVRKEAQGEAESNAEVEMLRSEMFTLKARCEEMESALADSKSMAGQGTLSTRCELCRNDTRQADVLREALEKKVHGMQEELKMVSTHLDDTTREIYRELSECGTRYSALRRDADDLRAMLGSFKLD